MTCSPLGAACKILGAPPPPTSGADPGFHEGGGGAVLKKGIIRSIFKTDKEKFARGSLNPLKPPPPFGSATVASSVFFWGGGREGGLF